MPIINLIGFKRFRMEDIVQRINQNISLKNYLYSKSNKIF